MEIGTLSLKILRELCTNSRISHSELGAKLGTSRYIIGKHISRLEEELGLHYTLELDYAKLGLSKLDVMRLKFAKKPSPAYIRQVVGKSDMVQLAMTMKSKDFDLVLFTTPRNTEEYAKWQLTFILKFAKYGVAPAISFIDILHLGMIPLNDWAINSSGVKDIYKKILVSLNKDSRQSISDLSRRIGLSEDLTRYYLIKLEKENIIKKFTALVTRPPLETNMILFVNYVFREGNVNRIFNKRKNVYFKQEDALPVVNEYQMVTSMSGSDYDLVWGVYENEKEAMKQCMDVHKSIFQKDTPTVRYGFVEEVVKGYLPLRSILIKDNFVTTAWVEEE